MEYYYILSIINGKKKRKFNVGGQEETLSLVNTTGYNIYQEAEDWIYNTFMWLIGQGNLNPGYDDWCQVSSIPAIAGFIATTSFALWYDNSLTGNYGYYLGDGTRERNLLSHKIWATNMKTTLQYNKYSYTLASVIYLARFADVMEYNTPFQTSLGVLPALAPIIGIYLNRLVKTSYQLFMTNTATGTIHSEAAGGELLINLFNTFPNKSCFTSSSNRRRI